MRLTEGGHQHSHLLATGEIPEAWRPLRSLQRLLSSPGHGKSDEAGTTWENFQGKGAWVFDQCEGSRDGHQLREKNQPPWSSTMALTKPSGCRNAQDTDDGIIRPMAVGSNRRRNRDCDKAFHNQ
ncbi:hypothetical protein H920_03505 [Fukomys damarensis]|uniref:Uncharacterized protein n=1 Tax=Fukomys damarensis TaxID=885580 RepID=A0A091DVI9_FUKDA|nr:hypothetical protein H920_03505 [Fukomys damarensis]